MKIEIACSLNDSTKDKGDLLELLSKDLLEALGYDVIEEIRFTGVEIDLLCKHKVNSKTIYVECKAHKDKIDAPILRQLCGTVMSYEYSEGWLISTSEFGKEAKGFVEMWKGKSLEQASRLSFYTPMAIIDSLQSTSVICKPPKTEAENIIGGKEFLGEWTLLVTKYGRFWAVYTLKGGAPSGVLLFNASNGRIIRESEMLNNISQLETPISTYDLQVSIDNTMLEASQSHNTNLPNVVEVQTGDSWDDYRPARPKDFVGRQEMQNGIIIFLNQVIKKQTNTRVFAITGNSGLGKSSIIAKIRDRSKNKFYKNRYFVFAIDMRGAKTPSYITASFLKCLQIAQTAGFGDPIGIQLTDPSSPLSAPSISQYLETVEKKGQLICLIFDQFEELYSKPELFGVFSAAKDLMFDVASNKRSFVLGFAWKTDSTTQQDHPAYHMWHELSDYRRTYKLDVFDSGEIAKAITTFEKEVNQKIPVAIRHQITHSCQGFPWLLKKLCINLYENLKKGHGTTTIQIDLDVGRLFENDIEVLSNSELTCLKLIAQKAPADWSEIIELSSVTILNSLVHKRLVIKSGDRLNIYWDIFKDYLLTHKVPVVPFNYVPTSDLSSMLKVAQVLNKEVYTGANDIADLTTLNEKTVCNIGADLVMFGIAERMGTTFKAHRELIEYTTESILQKIREKASKHSLKLAMYKNWLGKTVDIKIITEALKSCLPNANFSDKTWIYYSKRLTNLFTNLGFLIKTSDQIIIQDMGNPAPNSSLPTRKGKHIGDIFTAPAPLKRVLETMKNIEKSNSLENNLAAGNRNSLTILKRFNLITIKENEIVLNTAIIQQNGGYLNAI